MKRLALLILIGLALLSCKTNGNANSDTTGSSESPIQLTQLVNEFKANRDQTARKYNMKTLTVRGKVKEAFLDVDGKGSIVEFDTLDSHSSMTCYFPEQQTNSVSKLQKNQEATIKGKFLVGDYSNIEMQLDDCTLQ
jgi:hypothetical protein